MDEIQRGIRFRRFERDGMISSCRRTYSACLVEDIYINAEERSVERPDGCLYQRVNKKGAVTNHLFPLEVSDMELTLAMLSNKSQMHAAYNNC